MAQLKDAYTEHQLKRWMRPDAHRFVRADWRQHVRPGFEREFPFELYERKYSPDQPRDDRGRWTSEGAAARVADHHLKVRGQSRRSAAVVTIRAFCLTRRRIATIGRGLSLLLEFRLNAKQNVRSNIGSTLLSVIPFAQGPAGGRRMFSSQPMLDWGLCATNISLRPQYDDRDPPADASQRKFGSSNPYPNFCARKTTHGSWSCRYEIDWPDKKHALDVGGFNSAQAIVLALQLMRPVPK